VVDDVQFGRYIGDWKVEFATDGSKTWFAAYKIRATPFS
jgi:hypothetical protein